MKKPENWFAFLGDNKISDNIINVHGPLAGILSTFRLPRVAQHKCAFNQLEIAFGRSSLIVLSHRLECVHESRHEKYSEADQQGMGSPEC